ncbi:MAG: hypothetical protein CBR30_00290 [Dictyoglomus sp. NZ13-RE01]|nr:MAG: hypothetical protein CBR30_00290 [Dictyoglomus sp. NZ13-RE01]
MKPISNELWNVFSYFKLDEKLREHLLIEKWDEVVGNVLSQHTNPKSIRNGILFVDVDSSIWAQELSLLKHKIIEDLNNIFSSNIIKDIMFVDKGHTFRKKIKNKKVKSRAKLSLQEEERIDKIVESIEDSEIREIVRNYLKSLAMLNKGGFHGSEKR